MERPCDRFGMARGVEIRALVRAATGVSEEEMDCADCPIAQALSRMEAGEPPQLRIVS